MTAPLLQAVALRHAYGENPVLDGIDLELHAGERLLVVGPNGAGKTTLVRVLAGVLLARGGRVLLGERPLARLSRREVARALAVMPQEFPVPFPFSVREMVAMGRAPHMGPLGRESAADRAAIDIALATLGLRELATRAFPNLSGGEKQRVLLARAAAQEPSVLLLDEPTAHMDLGHRLHCFEWLRGWVAARPGSRAALVVTHDLWLPPRFADRMLVLDRGRIAAVGSPAAVLTPALLESVYGVEAEVRLDGDGGPVIVAARSRIRYPADPS